MMMAQPFQMGMAPGHPGLPHGHPMAGGQHPSAHMGGQPGGSMMQGMPMGVSGPQGAQGPMVTGMPPGPGTPAPGGPMQNAHAMAHLGVGQPAMFQNHNPQMNFPNSAQLAQQQQMMRQRHMLQAQQQQQQHGIPGSMPGGTGMSQAQLAQMRAAAVSNPMTIPMQQHMQAIQAQHAAPHHPSNMQQIQHQQQMIAQHQAVAARQAQAAQMQLSQSQEQHSQPPPAQSTPAPQGLPQPQPQQQGTPQQSSQQPQPGQSQGQNQNNIQQQQQQQPAQSSQPVEQQMAQQERQLNQQQASQAMNLQQRMMQKPMVGLSILKLMQYQDQLGLAPGTSSLDHWENFVAKFFSPAGILKQQIYCNEKKIDKTFRIEYPTLPRFYQSHFHAGIKQIWMSMLSAAEREIPSTGGHTVWSNEASTKYVYQNDHIIVTTGTLRAHFDAENRIEYLYIGTSKWVEYIPRSSLQPQGSPDQKQSPKVTKNMKSRQAKALPPSGVALPDTQVNDYGVPRPLMQFLEIAEVFSQMTNLIHYSLDHPSMRPMDALVELVKQNSAQEAARKAGAAALNPGMQPTMGGRMPGMNGPNQFASPRLAHLGLPTGQGSPHMGGPIHTPSPAQNHIAGPVAMVHQQSQQGSNLSGSQGTSANTSPNVSSKRRRASAVKLEDDGGGTEVNGAAASKVKPSPRMNAKRQKGTAG